MRGLLACIFGGTTFTQTDTVWKANEEANGTVTIKAPDCVTALHIREDRKMKIYLLRICNLCITIIWLLAIGELSLANEIVPTITDPIKREIKNGDSRHALWLEQTGKKCQLNDFHACSEIAAMFKILNKSKLFWFYYDKACTGLHAESCAKLGRIFTQGDGQILDQQAGRYFYGKACDLGNRLSCEAIAWNSDENVTCIKDDNPEECRISACEKQDAGHTCLIVAMNYYNGTHSSGKNDTLAAVYFRKACKRKNGNGCLNLADLYRVGIDTPTNKAKMLKYYAKGCLYENNIACQKTREWVDKNSLVNKKLIIK